MKRKRRSKAGAFYFIYMLFPEIPNFHSPFRRAVVIVPPFRDFYFTAHRFSSLGATIVASLLRHEGLQVAVVNFPLMKPKGKRIEIPYALQYLDPCILPEETGKLSFFTHFRRFGPDIDQCVAIIDSAKPDICFLSVFAFCYADDALDLAEKIRKKMPSVPIVAGGAGVSVYPGYFLRKGSVDFALCGEAEAGIAHFMREISGREPDYRRVPNLAWKKHGTEAVSPIRTYAAESEIEVPLVKTAESARSVTFSTSCTRGCPRRCAFCSSGLLFGSKIRIPDLARLEYSLSMLSKSVLPDGRRPVFNFEDDNLLYDERFLKALMSAVKKYFPGAGFIAENGIDYSILSPDLCEWLVQNGMNKFNLSLASVAPEILRKQNRPLQLEHYENILGYLAGSNIATTTYFICGFKEDTLESTAFNLAYLYYKQTVIGISMFYAVPGLKNFIDPACFDRSSSLLCLGSAAYPWNDSLPTETMITAFRLSRYINLFKSAGRSEKEDLLLSTIGKKRLLYTYIKKENRGEEELIEVPVQDKELVRRFFSKIS